MQFGPTMLFDIVYVQDMVTARDKAREQDSKRARIIEMRRAEHKRNLHEQPT